MYVYLLKYNTKAMQKIIAHILIAIIYNFDQLLDIVRVKIKQIFYVPSVRHMCNPLLNTNHTQGHLHALLEPPRLLISEKSSPKAGPLILMERHI